MTQGMRPQLRCAGSPLEPSAHPVQRGAVGLPACAILFGHRTAEWRSGFGCGQRRRGAGAVADARCQGAPQQVRAAAAAASAVADPASATAVSYVCRAECRNPWVAHGSIDFGTSGKPMPRKGAQPRASPCTPAELTCCPRRACPWRHAPAGARSPSPTGKGKGKGLVALVSTAGAPAPGARLWPVQPRQQLRKPL